MAFCKTTTPWVLTDWFDADMKNQRHHMRTDMKNHTGIELSNVDDFGSDWDTSDAAGRAFFRCIQEELSRGAGLG